MLPFFKFMRFFHCIGLNLAIGASLVFLTLGAATAEAAAPIHDTAAGSHLDSNKAETVAPTVRDSHTAPLQHATLGEGFTLILSAQKQNRYGGPIMLDAGSMTTDELPELFSSLEPDGPGTLLPPLNEPVQVLVVVPKNAPLSYRQKFLNEIATAIRARYPKAQFELKESFVDLNEDARVLLEQKEEIDQLQARSNLSAVDREILQNAENEIEKGLQEDQALCESWFQKSCPTFYRFFNASWKATRHPYNTVIAARAVAMTKFGISASVTLSKYGVNPVSVAIATLQGGVAAIFGYNAKKWSEWCTSHTFPFFKDLGAVRWYNKNGWFKSATINFIRSFGLSYVFRMMAHLSGQTVNGKTVETANSLDFFVSGLGIALPEIFLDGLMDDGLRSLELKGRVNDQLRKYLLWTVSFIDTAMHTSFRIGDVHMAYAFAFVSWGSKTSLWLASKVLKARTQRFVVLSNALNQEQAGRTVSVKNFLGYVLGAGVLDTIYNRVTGKFTVPDRTMVEQDLGVDEVWKLSLESSELERLRRDPDLSEGELRSMLKLKDTDREIVKRMLDYRKTQLGRDFTPAEMCAAALR